jgi:hypothetical protein
VITPEDRERMRADARAAAAAAPRLTPAAIAKLRQIIHGPVPKRTDTGGEK